MKPIIGVLSTYREETQARYIKAVENAGGSPVILAKVNDIKTMESIIPVLDGIVFTGGVDINPLIYGETPQEGLGRIDPDRDKFELALAKVILFNTDIPVVGICRGMQILNVAAGGSLYQDLVVQNKTEVIHSLEDVFPWHEPSHNVNIVKPSKLYDIFKKDNMLVNSFHHQGIKKLDNNFEAVMVSEDNVIEGIELKDDRFVIGVQWHPEMLVEKYPEYLNLFRKFIEKCYENKKSDYVSA